MPVVALCAAHPRRSPRHGRLPVGPRGGAAAARRKWTPGTRRWRRGWWRPPSAGWAGVEAAVAPAGPPRRRWWTRCWAWTCRPRCARPWRLRGAASGDRGGPARPYFGRRPRPRGPAERARAAVTAGLVARFDALLGSVESCSSSRRPAASRPTTRSSRGCATRWPGPSPSGREARGGRDARTGWPAEGCCSRAEGWPAEARARRPAAVHRSSTGCGAARVHGVPHGDTGAPELLERPWPADRSLWPSCWG